MAKNEKTQPFPLFLVLYVTKCMETKNTLLALWCSKRDFDPKLPAKETFRLVECRDYRLAWTGGIRLRQGISCSSQLARRIRASSLPNLPMNCTPIGRPDWLYPSGKLMAARPHTHASPLAGKHVFNFQPQPSTPISGFSGRRTLRTSLKLKCRGWDLNLQLKMRLDDRLSDFCHWC